MRGDAFRRENVSLAHAHCEVCELLAKTALQNFRETKSMKTRSTSQTHWAEVTHNRKQS